MPKFDYRKLTPLPIKLIMIVVAVFSFFLISDFVMMHSPGRTILKVLISFLLAVIFVHFVLYFLSQRSISKIAPDTNKQAKFTGQEVRFKELVEKAAPLGYKLEVSLEKKFSFCYPESWLIVRPDDPLLYMQAREPKLEKDLTILRNFNVSVQNIEGLNTDFLFEAIINGVLKALKEGKLEFKEPFNAEETWGMRYKINYKNPQGTDLCCYQNAITNQNKSSLVLITFTTEATDFSKTREFFDKIAGLVKIFD